MYNSVSIRMGELVEGVTDATRIADSQPRIPAADFLAVIEKVRQNSRVYFEGGKAQSSWKDAVRAMEASPQGFAAVYEMACTGHRPMVFHETPDEICVGTGLTLPPYSSWGSVYNAAAGAEIDKRNQKLSDSKKLRWKGTAVDRVAAMGAKLMPAEHWERVALLRFYDPERDERSNVSGPKSFLDSSAYLPKSGDGIPSVVMTVSQDSIGLVRAFAHGPLLAGEMGFHCFTSFKK